MKYFVNFIDLETKTVIEHAVDNKFFTSYDSAKKFAEECRQEFEKVSILLRLKKKKYIAPQSVDYVVYGKKE